MKLQQKGQNNTVTTLNLILQKALTQLDHGRVEQVERKGSDAVLR